MSTVRITHLGGPTTLIEVGPWRLLTDPTFDPPGRRYGFGWGTSSRKMAGPAREPAAIGAIDAVLLSHDHHADNLDDAGRALLPGAGTVFTTVSGARRLGGNSRGLANWQRTSLERPGAMPITVTATPCRHGPPGSHPIVGDVIGFALEWPGQEHGAFWMTGDTVLYSGVREVAARLRIGTILVHLGAVRFSLTGPLRYTMTAREAVELGGLIEPRTLIPVHYEGWSHFSEERAAIEGEFAKAPEAVRRALRWIPIGQATEVGT